MRGTTPKPWPTSAPKSRERPSIGEANRRWQTSFASFDAIDGPRRDKPATDQYWLDWMRFRSGAIHQFLVDCAKTIRKEDPKRLIMVYADGLVPERLGEFRALGCMTANGGCADPDRGVPPTSMWRPKGCRSVPRK